MAKLEESQFKKISPNIFLIFLLLLYFAWPNKFSQTNSKWLQIPYSEFQKLLAEKKIDELNISDKNIRGKFTYQRTDKKVYFTTNRIEPELAKDLAKSEVTYSRDATSNIFEGILAWVFPIILFYLFWVYLIKKSVDKGGFTGGLMSIGKSRAKLYVETDVKITFSDVAGVEEAKAELREVVDFLKNPEEYGRLGARMPRGILLIGPPGTGKTLLAKSVAGEAQVPFFSISGSEFVELFVGVGAARVRDLFVQAKTKAPCIVFIDELDSLGKTRSGIVGGGLDEKEQTLNQLLAELDGFDTASGVVILAATNRPETLDPALLRSGRFDRQVLVDKPDKAGRIEILKVHIKKIKIDPNINLEHLAALTSGFTGADLANLVNEAALTATRKHSALITEDDFTMAIERIVAGLEKKNRIFNAKEKQVIAFHEMGHTILAIAIPGNDKVHKVSIISRGIGSLGYTIQRRSEDRYIMTKKELLNKIVVLLGGRAAELLIFNELSTGAADDLVKVTNIAEEIVTKFGMSENLGPVVFEEQNNPYMQGMMQNNLHRLRSEDAAKMIDIEMRNIIEDSFQKAIAILSKNRATLEVGAKLLLEKETLVEEDINHLASTVIHN